jgi:hypothetical protein
VRSGEVHGADARADERHEGHEEVEVVRPPRMEEPW